MVAGDAYRGKDGKVRKTRIVDGNIVGVNVEVMPNELYCPKHKKQKLTFVKSLDLHNCFVCVLCNEERNRSE